MNNRQSRLEGVAEFRLTAFTENGNHQGCFPPFDMALRRCAMMLLYVILGFLPERALRNAPAALEPEPREQHHGNQ